MTLITPYIYALVAGLCAVSVEVVFRKTNFHYWSLLWFIVPLQIILGYCVYQIFNNATSLLSAAIVFSFGTYTMRIIAGYLVLGEQPPINTVLAFSLIVLAQFVRLIKF